ncbi:TRAP transporter large permease [Microbaculum marinum]|uniref:TRAP transporter large permease protein n=1 Tax=Microbaculum marinum TaxID=1764581 RepID=A0AAW9RT31_9HYPH
MANELLAPVGFAALFALMVLQVPIGIAMAIVGFAGYATVVGFGPAMSVLASAPIRTASDPALALLPLFILMGVAAFRSGISARLFDAGLKTLGHWRGGLALSTIAASAGFAAICGSSAAGAATMTRIALKPMRDSGYDEGVAAATIAVGGTLGILIPPSVALAVFGILTEQDIGRLFVAGLVPGILAVVMHMGVIAIISRVSPESLPQGARFGWRDRLAAYAKIWPIVLIFLLVLGGMYYGYFTPTEAAAMGAIFTLAIGVLRGQLPIREIGGALVETCRTSASIFLILIGAVMFGYFLAVTGAPHMIAGWIGTLDLPPLVILALILFGYLILGCFLDSLAMIVLTVPIIFPIIQHLGFDPIWFGVLVVITIELGLITPPVGLNVFVIKSMETSLPLGAIYRGVLPFVGMEILRLALLTAFPWLVLALPNSMR